MIRFITTLILSAVLALAVKGQNSLNEKTAFWTTGSNWSGGTMPGTLSAGTVTLNGKTIVINGTVKSLDNITSISSNFSINAGDTLVILGDLSMTLSSFTNNGVLIVFGNFANGLSNTVVNGSGKMVVTGNYTNALGANTLTGPTYVFGSTPGGGFPATGDAGDLQTNDPALYNYQQNMLAILPIELAYFDASLENNQVQLTWGTISETNNDYFLIERSSDGIHYDLVQRVAGAGNSKNTLGYKIFDHHPLYGRSYYKLSQVDFDGQRSEFRAISVFNNEKIALQVYPNPTVDFLYFNCSVCHYSVTLRDANDRFRTQRIPVTDFGQGKSGIDLTQLDPGVYFIGVTDSESALPSTYRIIKK